MALVDRFLKLGNKPPSIPEKKILYIITHLALGGATETMLAVADYMQQKGWDITIAYGWDPIMEKEGNLIDFCQTHNLKLILVKHLKRKIRPLSDFIALKEVREIIKKGHYSIVHTHSSKAGIIGRLAAHLLGHKIIIHTVHGWSFNNYQRLLIRKLFYFLERVCASFSKALIVVSPYDQYKGMAKKLGDANKYYLIRSGIDLLKYQNHIIDKPHKLKELGLDGKSLLVGSVMRMSKQKDPFTLLRAVRLIRDNIIKENITFFSMMGKGIKA